MITCLPTFTFDCSVALDDMHLPETRFEWCQSTNPGISSTRAPCKSPEPKSLVWLDVGVCQLRAKRAASQKKPNERRRTSAGWESTRASIWRDDRLFADGSIAGSVGSHGLGSRARTGWLGGLAAARGCNGCLVRL